MLVGAAKTWGASGDEKTAEEFLRRAIDADASNFDAYTLLAQLYVPQRKLDQALAEYDKLAARQPGAVGPPTMAGLVLEAQGKQEEARRRYEDVVEKVTEGGGGVQQPRVDVRHPRRAARPGAAARSGRRPDARPARRERHARASCTSRSNSGRSRFLTCSEP